MQLPKSIPLKYLSAEGMVIATKKWVTPKSKERRHLESVEELKPLVGNVLVKAQNKLLELQTSGARAARLAEISLEATEQDELHDDNWRSVDARIESEIRGCKAPETQKALRALRLKLLPVGLTLIGKSYRDQAGAAELLLSRLTDEDKALLQRMKTLEGTLWDWVVEAVKAAQRLDELEDAREDVQLEGTVEPKGTAVQNARLQWMRAINAMLSVLSSLDSVPEEVVKLFDRLARKAAKAARRAGDGSADDEEDDEEDDDEGEEDDEGGEDGGEAEGSEAGAETAAAAAAAAAQRSGAGAPGTGARGAGDPS